MSKGTKSGDDEVCAVRTVVRDRVTSVDPRAQAAWRRWLATLAHDADAVIAAVLAYESLDDEGRDAWLDALDADAPDVGAPAVALYAPLLGVEQGAARRARMTKNLDGAAKKSAPARAFVAKAPSAPGDRLCLVVTPPYLAFVELLFCRYHQDEGIRDARHKWLTHGSDVVLYERELGVRWKEAPLPEIVEELAHAVVADRRAGRPATPALVRCMDLFAPDLRSYGVASATGTEDGDDG